MSGLPYQGGMNSLLNNFTDVSQYGVSMDSDTQALKGAGSLASMIPYIGPALGFMFNFWAQQNQNQVQEDFYNNYMSPASKMAQMRAAGINPAAAAQGISGGSFGQMNAAAPTNAYSSLAEALGNSYNTSLSAQNIAAQTKNLEVQSRGQDLQNKMLEVELGLKPDMVNAELEEKKASASEMRQNVINLKKEIDKIDQEIKTLHSEEMYYVAKEGQVAFENRLMDAEKRKADAEANLAKANKELTDVNKQIREKDRDNYLTPEEQIKMPIETAYNVDPIHADFTDARKAIESIDDALKQCLENDRLITNSFINGKINEKQYRDMLEKNDDYVKQLNKLKRSSKDAYDKIAYKNGYHDWWQDNASSIISSVTGLAGSLGSAAIHASGFKNFGSKSGATNTLDAWRQGGYGN